MSNLAQTEQSLITDGVPRDFRQLGEDHYRLTLDHAGIEFKIDRLRRERHELIGELTVRSSLSGARTFEGVLSVGDFNLSSVRARQDRGRYLERLAQTKPCRYQRSFLRCVLPRRHRWMTYPRKRGRDENLLVRCRQIRKKR